MGRLHSRTSGSPGADEDRTSTCVLTEALDCSGSRQDVDCFDALHSDDFTQRLSHPAKQVRARYPVEHKECGRLARWRIVVVPGDPDYTPGLRD
jgi:hypothetical protein